MFALSVPHPRGGVPRNRGLPDTRPRHGKCHQPTAPTALTPRARWTRTTLASLLATSPSVNPTSVRGVSSGVVQRGHCPPSTLGGPWWCHSERLDVVAIDGTVGETAVLPTRCAGAIPLVLALPARWVRERPVAATTESGVAGVRATPSGAFVVVKKKLL